MRWFFINWLIICKFICYVEFMFDCFYNFWNKVDMVWYKFFYICVNKLICDYILIYIVYGYDLFDICYKFYNIGDYILKWCDKGMDNLLEL